MSQISKFISRSLILLFPSLLIAPLTLSQIEITPKQLHFGTTSPRTQWVVDIIIQNNGSKKDFLLRHTFSHEYEVLFTSKTLMPDSSITMRVHFKPRAKGKFSEDIKLYFASMQEPVLFNVSALVEYKNPDDNIPCPDFSQLAADCCVNNMFVCEVIDAGTNKPLPNASVVISEEQTQRMKLTTNSEGKVSNTIPISYYTIAVSHKDYLPSSKAAYINHRNNYFRFGLTQVQNEIIEEKEETVMENAEMNKDSLVISSIVLPEDKYKPNNIVFLLDVSSSMRIGEKMKLMRSSLNELVIALRPSDKISLISYADSSKVLLATTGGDNKGAITPIVNGMKAGGNTAGALGFQTGYDILIKEWIDNGNNQLIVITDGAFRPEDQKKIKRLVKRAARKNMKTSVIGVEANYYDAEKLSGVCRKGNGSFILIDDDADLQLIVDEVKKQSAK